MEQETLSDWTEKVTRWLLYKFKIFLRQWLGFGDICFGAEFEKDQQNKYIVK